MALCELSIIIPTLNRADVLVKALESIRLQSLDPSRFELIVVDNGSTDSTKAVVEKFAAENPKLTVRYIFDAVPGLLTGRHHGMEAAASPLLSFIDDDVKLAPSWAASVIEGFKNPQVHLVGGPCLPDYETSEIPSWVQYLWHPHPQGRFCPFYSLLDFGDKTAVVSPNMIWGLNFSIRKESLKVLGGFHPDCMPPTLAYLTGTGETGVTRTLKAKGWLALYHPGAKVFHLVSKSRLTMDYVKRRAFYQGLTRSAYEYRIDKGVDRPEIPDDFIAKSPRVILQKIFERLVKRRLPAYKNLRQLIVQEDQRGFDYHRKKMQDLPGLSEWHLKKDYFDYKIPESLISHDT